MRILKLAALGLSIPGLFTGGYLTARAQNDHTWGMRGTPLGLAEEFPQVTLVYAHRERVQGVDVDLVMVPKEERVALGIIPLDEQAPLPAESVMICRPYTILRGGPEPGTLSTDIGFRCGSHKWIFSKLDIQ